VSAVKVLWSQFACCVLIETRRHVVIMSVSKFNLLFLFLQYSPGHL
jgi:hypothetical protein